MVDANTRAIERKLDRIRSLGLEELRLEWRRLYHSDAPRISRDLLILGLGYRVQEIEKGGLGKATRRKLQTIAKALRTTGRVILSQKHEGWTVLPAQYDDGGYSGGTMERPALKRLLVDIEASQVDVVVVYKVDRLTRALSDFAKLVEVFDRRAVSFVSITQQFNTTTSMGRLTLNVLLSFAQFEREVIGERVRDKIAASKKKGMWMGGMPPLGYDVKDRKLVVNKNGARTVVDIYHRYLVLKSVRDLHDELAGAGIRSKRRVRSDGSTYGGQKIARGALYLMLQNRIYQGEITHKGKSYSGEHPAIIDKPLWDGVQAVLAQNRVERATGTRAKYPSLWAALCLTRPANALHQPTRSRRKLAIDTMSLHLL